MTRRRLAGRSSRGCLLATLHCLGALSCERPAAPVPPRPRPVARRAAAGGPGSAPQPGGPAPEPLTGVRSVVLETWRGCAVRADRTVACWGTPRGGAITEHTLARGYTAPRVVAGLSDVAQLALGGTHGCAALRDGTARCWGDNTMGQLGDGTIEDRREAVAVVGLHDVVEVAAGSAHSCARLADGTVRCWGANTQAQLALANPEPPGASALFGGSSVGSGGRAVFHGPAASQRPVAIAGITDATALSAHKQRTCVIHGVAHQVSCWGAESGSATVEDAHPAAVPGLVGVTSLSRHDSLTCAALADGTVRCQGANQHGQCGDGSAATYHSQPVVVSGLRDATAVAASGDHACAVTRPGLLVCWGSNAAGELGDGGTTSRAAPAPVPGLRDVSQVAVTGQVSCAVERRGRLLCWGSDDMGQLGDGSERATPSPGLVSGLPDAVELAMGSGFACARRAGGTVVCWGANTAGQLGDGTHDLRTHPVPVRGVTGASAVAADGSAACAITTGGAVRCWGASVPGGLADAPASAAAAGPAEVPGLAGVTSLVLADDVRCARSGRRPWRCWGRNGPLGVEPPDDVAIAPRPAARLGDVESPVIEQDYACGVSRAGELVCARGAEGSPVTVAGVGRLRALRGYASRICLVRGSGAVDCAEDFEGRAPNARVLARVPGLADAIDVGVGNGFRCALRRTGRVACWGSNYDGQLGQGTRSAAERTEPLDVPGLADVVQLVVSGESACARQRAGTVRCWGGNRDGQSGNGSSSTVPSPLELTARVIGAGAPPGAAALEGGAPDAGRTGDAGIERAAGDGGGPATESDGPLAGPMDDPFCRNAPSLLGQTGAVRVFRCVPMNRTLGIYWVVLTGPDVPDGSVRRVVVVQDGVPVPGRGVDAMAAYYRSVRLYRQPALTARDAVMVLQHFDAFPPGFDENADDVGRLPWLPELGLRRDPFTLRLAQPEHRSYGGRGGGVTPPPSWSLATLHGDGAYHFAWTVSDLGRGR